MGALRNYIITGLLSLVQTLHAEPADSCVYEPTPPPRSDFEATLDSIERELKIRDAISMTEEAMLQKEMRYTKLTSDLGTLTGGLISTWRNHKFLETPGTFRDRENQALEYIPASIPLLATWTLRSFALESRSKMPRMITANALSIAIMVATSQTLKHTISETRPNGKDDKSFISGHSALAFMSAAILDREYGHYSPWISLGGYMCATSTQLIRLRNNGHHVNNVLLGAAIGTMSVNISYYITDMLQKGRYINRPRVTFGDLTRFSRFLIQPVSFGLSSGTELGEREIMNGDIRLSSTFQSSLQYSYFFNDRWAFDAIFRTSTTQAKRVSEEKTFNINQNAANIGMQYSMPITPTSRYMVRLISGVRHSDAKTNLVKNGFAPQVGIGTGIDLFDNNKYITGISCEYIHTFTSLMRHRFLISTHWKVLL